MREERERTYDYESRHNKGETHPLPISLKPTLMAIGNFNYFELIVGETTSFSLLLTSKTLALDFFYKASLQVFQMQTKKEWGTTLPNW